MAASFSLDLAFALASTTVPETADDAGMGTLPPTLTGVTTVEEKLSPVWLALEPRAWFSAL
jgi:hypothetical protein